MPRRTGMPLIPLLVTPQTPVKESPLVCFSRISFGLYRISSVNSRHSVHVTIERIEEGFWRALASEPVSNWNQGSLETCIEWAYQYVERYA